MEWQSGALEGDPSALARWAPHKGMVTPEAGRGMNGWASAPMPSQ